MKGWMRDISNSRKFSDLPKRAQEYILKIEELSEVPGNYKQLNAFTISSSPYFYFIVKWIGVGPARESIIERPKNH